jgi:hypothetical protein
VRSASQLLRQLFEEFSLMLRSVAQSWVRLIRIGALSSAFNRLLISQRSVWLSVVLAAQMQSLVAAPMQRLMPEPICPGHP